MKRQKKKNRNLFTGEINVYRESNNELIMTLSVENRKKTEFTNMFYTDGNLQRFDASIDFIPRTRT